MQKPAKSTINHGRSLGRLDVVEEVCASIDGVVVATNCCQDN
jgi:hypothetical protein